MNYWKLNRKGIFSHLGGTVLSTLLIKYNLRPNIMCNDENFVQEPRNEGERGRWGKQVRTDRSSHNYSWASYHYLVVALQIPASMLSWNGGGRAGTGEASSEGDMERRVHWKQQYNCTNTQVIQTLSWQATMVHSKNQRNCYSTQRKKKFTGSHTGDVKLSKVKIHQLYISTFTTCNYVPAN